MDYPDYILKGLVNEGMAESESEVAAALEDMGIYPDDAEEMWRELGN